MNTRPAIPDGLLLSWYGDDFTGSAAVLEVLSLAGLPAVLFFDIPTPELLAKFSGYRGVGIAGVARSMSPSWMETHLPPVFQALARLNAPIAHYKVCSTLDSAPQVGSIGKAIDLAEAQLASDWIPLLIAAPAIHRYQLFGNLFATVGGVAYRLDRHPTMSRHPVTPMNEADVRLHLAKQTETSIGLVDYLALNKGRGGTQLKSELAAGRRVVAFDVIDDASLVAVGRLIWENRGDGLFAVGSPAPVRLSRPAKSLGRKRMASSSFAWTCGARWTRAPGPMHWPPRRIRPCKPAAPAAIPSCSRRAARTIPASPHFSKR